MVVLEMGRPCSYDEMMRCRKHERNGMNLRKLICVLAVAGAALGVDAEEVESRFRGPQMGGGQRLCGCRKCLLGTGQDRRCAPVFLAVRRRGSEA